MTIMNIYAGNLNISRVGIAVKIFMMNLMFFRNYYL